MMPAIRERFLREERGFSLPEMMTTILIMIIVFFALYGIFDTSVRIFAFGNNKAEAVESARVGLEKMEREIRAAYAVDGNDPANTHLFFSADGSTTNPPQAMPTATQITFGNDLGAGGAGNEKIECGTPCEYITYKLTVDNDASNAPCTAYPCDLRRVNTANSTDAGSPVVENVMLNGLTFTYYTSDGSTVATTEGAIAKVRVRLRIAESPGTRFEATQVLTTEIDLRNRA